MGVWARLLHDGLGRKCLPARTARMFPQLEQCLILDVELLPQPYRAARRQPDTGTHHADSPSGPLLFLSEHLLRPVRSRSRKAALESRSILPAGRPDAASAGGCTGRSIAGARRPEPSEGGTTGSAPSRSRRAPGCRRCTGLARAPSRRSPRGCAQAVVGFFENPLTDADQRSNYRPHRLELLSWVTGSGPGRGTACTSSRCRTGTGSSGSAARERRAALGSSAATATFASAGGLPDRSPGSAPAWRPC